MVARSFQPVSCTETCTVTPLAVADSTLWPLVEKCSQPGALACQRTMLLTGVAVEGASSATGASAFLPVKLRYMRAT